MTQPFPVDGRMDIERLRLLLDVQTEYPSLDYKSDCDLRNPRGKYEFVKDVAGMMSRPEGSYLVVGVDGRGQPIGAQLDLKLFDESRLRILLTKYLEGNFIIASQVHELDGHQVAVLFFGRRPDGLFPIVKGDCSYPDPVKGEVTALRGGDVFFRDGTVTRRWRSGDLPALLAPYIDAIRQAERSRLGEFLEEIQPALRGQRVAQGPLAALTWRLSEAEFDAAVAELSRQRDDAAIRMLTLQLRRSGVSLMRSTADGALEELQDVLDRATSAVATAIVLGDRELFDLVLNAMAATFDAGAADTDGTPRGNGVTIVWLGIATRVLALIALAIRAEEWWAVRPLTLHPVGTTFRRESWLRHALTWGYRTEQMSTGTSGNAVPGALIALARQTVARLPALRLDIADDDTPLLLGQAPARVDPISDSLCHADLLWCVVAAATGTRSAFYPSFSSLDQYRTEPMVRRLFNEPDLVQQLVPKAQSPDDIRPILRSILQLAEKENHWCEDWTQLVDDEHK